MSERTRRILKMCEMLEPDGSSTDETMSLGLGHHELSSDVYEPSSTSKDESVDFERTEIRSSNHTDQQHRGMPENQDEYPDSDGSIIPSSIPDRQDENQQLPDTENQLPLRRKRRPWKRQIRKQKKLKGESYENSLGIMKPACPLQPAPCRNKPKHTCTSLVNPEYRMKIYTDYRALPTVEAQMEFIARHVSQGHKKRCTTAGSSRRANTSQYFFTVDGTQQRVCRRFFMATLNATDAMLRKSMTKLSDTGMMQPDMRGRHVPKNKLLPEVEADIKNFLNSFSTVESHYCRARSQRKYFESTLNITTMHKMYTRRCEENDSRNVSFETFRKIFREHNVGFFVPKKDQCKRCLVFQGMNPEEKSAHEEDHQTHLMRKQLARNERDMDKQLALENDSYLCFNFDLEAVLNVPKGSAGQIFYMRKLAVYNLTIFDLKSHEVDCYLWNESQGKRGANEIASCLTLYLQNKCTPNITKIHMMSDSCGGQNKNSIMMAMCIHMVKIVANLQILRHTFFEVGHSEMECDSIHSKIEKKSKHVPVYVPEGWAQIVRSAREKPSPYRVHNLLFDDFLQFSASEKLFDVPWRKVCSYEIRKTNDGQVEVFFRNNYDDEFVRAPCKRTRGRPSKDGPPKAYERPLPISSAKLKDLRKMCDDLTIPKAYHNFYSSLISDKTVRDNLPEPHLSESSEYEE